MFEKGLTENEEKTMVCDPFPDACSPGYDRDLPLSCGEDDYDEF